MKKTANILFIAVFLGLCLVLSLGMLIAGPSQAGANERLADAPQLMTQDGVNADFLSDLADWVNDRFFLRQELISLEHWLTANLLGTSGDDGVILGTEGWLYYADTLADYTGTDPMTERELYSAAKNLSLMAGYCRERGSAFLFVIAPNKNSLYDENMPDYGVTADISNARRLLTLLEAVEVDTVDLFTAFQNEDEVLYFAHDSHWNSQGAALGADQINAAFGVESRFYSAKFNESVPHDGDLYAMLYPAFADPETDPVYSGVLSYTITSAATKADAITLTTESDADVSLLAYRDSFGNLLYPYLASSYGTAKFSRATAYDLTEAADCVLIELVERNLRYLIQYVPVMTSPQQAVQIPETVAGSVAVTTKERGGFTLVTGAVPDVDETSPVYVLCGGTAYEAFCLADNGFAVNLPEGSAAEGVICAVDGVMVCYEIEN